jgi:hypothetical protein
MLLALPLVVIPCLLLPHALLHLQRPPARAGMPPACSSAFEEFSYESCMKMRVSELKAELDLRGLSYAGVMEKEGLATLLADARVSGRADPSLINDFNRQSAESMLDAESATEISVEDVAEATAGDGSLPGGMSPETLVDFMQNPEMMSLLRNPRMQEVMQKVMQDGPEGAKSLMDDPEVREMLQKVQDLTNRS